MTEFFKKTEFGRELKKISDRTNHIACRSKVYKVTEKNQLGLSKGDYFYIDKCDEKFFHLEVYNERGKAKLVLELDGKVNLAKTQSAIKEGRTIDI